MYIRIRILNKRIEFLVMRPLAIITTRPFQALNVANRITRTVVFSMVTWLPGPVRSFYWQNYHKSRNGRQHSFANRSSCCSGKHVRVSLRFVQNLEANYPKHYPESIYYCVRYGVYNDVSVIYPPTAVEKDQKPTYYYTS